MLKLGFTCFCGLLLTLMGWLGSIPSVSAQPTSPSLPLASAEIASPFIATTAPIAMTKKSLFSFSGSRPANLGVKDGKLAACPGSPNCVSSQAPASDLEHKIEPIAYSSSPSEAMAKLKTVIENMERTEIITDTENYLYAEFTTPLMGFVDDVEFYLDPNASVIQVRSASRLGQSDLGLNRKRVEAIRASFAQAS